MSVGISHSEITSIQLIDVKRKNDLRIQVKTL